MDRDLLETLFRRAVDAAQPVHAVRANLPTPPVGRTIVIGAGKASAQMAQAFEAAWDGPIDGLVVTRYGYGAPCERIEIVEAAHPVPDFAGFLAARRIMEKLSGLSHDDLVVALISGGGSALLPQPAAGLSFEDEQAVNQMLLASGAPISVMNVIRNELSAIKGGRLAALAAPARVATLVVSDVPGDDPSLVASGPTVPLAATRAEARHLVALYRLQLPAAAEHLLASEDNPAPRPADPRFARNSVRVIASAALSLDAAASAGAAMGLTPHILSDAVEGEARDVALVHAAIAIEGVEGITALAADTDGIDGAGDNAGATADGQTAIRMRAAGIDPRAALANNDAYTAFRAVNGLVITGPTGTNVNDFRAIIVR